MAKEREEGAEHEAKEKALNVGKDLKESHGSYAEAMRKRAALHDALIDEDYRKGYVSMDESPGKDNAPMMTHRVRYNHISDRKKGCEVVQTFKDNKGSGDTVLTHDKNSDNKLATSPGY